MLGTAGLSVLDPYVTEWLNLVIRSLHVVAAIAWIGASFYFIALDHHLDAPPADAASEGVGGESWEIHGGGFYRVHKYRVAPPSLPERLHWFKWEAYTTWLSGFGLMVVLYYLQADTFLVDRAVADIPAGVAVAASVGLLVAAWLVYDTACRLLGGRDLALAALVVALVVGSAWGASELFAARAAYLQVGAMLGTIMAGNVLMVIIPGQRELVAAKRAAREPDPGPGLRGKQRSVHNNYLTLPVLFTMLAGHFPMTYGSGRPWLVLVALLAIGAVVRHFFNLRHRGRSVWAIPIAAALALAALAIAIRPDRAPPSGSAVVPFGQARAIVERRCTGCHSATPSIDGFTSAPLGIAFDTPAEITSRASEIRRQAVDSTAMPLGNLTRMTTAERRLLGDWIRAGARESP